MIHCNVPRHDVVHSLQGTQTATITQEGQASLGEASARCSPVYQKAYQQTVWACSVIWLFCVHEYVKPTNQSTNVKEQSFCVQDNSSNDEYLFDLDHFVSMAAEPSSDVDPNKLPPLPNATSPHQSDSDVHLVLDARCQGRLNLCVCMCVCVCVP